MKHAFRIHPSDNVATLLADAAEEDIDITGAATEELVYCGPKIALGHKVAVLDIPMGSPIVKYGVVIGSAIQPIAKGQWVHLHNCRSPLDERSGTLDLLTGSSRDVPYE